MRLYRFLSIFLKGPSSPDDVGRVAYDVCRLMMYHRRRMETETKAKCRRFGMGGKIECRTGNLCVIV